MGTLDALFSDLIAELTAPITKEGSDGNDLLLGRFGDDHLSGNRGDDILLGLAGNDTLIGGAGHDLLIAGSGHDVLDGGPGNNVLLGGRGTDSFIVSRKDGLDLIVDYQGRDDQFILQDGLTFAQLAITQENSNTQIRYLGRDEPSLILKGTQAGTLGPENFLSAQLTPDFNKLTVFGDSLSDPGNLFNLTGRLFPPPPYSEGRLSDGAIWTDFFTQSLDLNPTDQVSNFAVGGALTGRDNGVEPLLESLTGVELELPGVLDEVDQFVASSATGEDYSDELFVVWAGSNDILNLPADPQAASAFIAESINNIVAAVTTLVEQGAETFLIPNLPDLGLIPGNLNQDTSAPATVASIAFNEGLDLALSSLEADPSTDIDIVPVDIFSLTNEILNRPEEFGFTDVTNQLIEQGLSENPGFFWWDQQHPTERVHSLLSDVFQSALLEAGYVTADTSFGV